MVRLQAFLSSQKVTVHNLESVALLLMRAADGSASSSDAGTAWAMGAPLIPILKETGWLQYGLDHLV